MKTKILLPLYLLGLTFTNLVQAQVENWIGIDLTPGQVTNIPNMISITFGDGQYAATGFVAGSKSFYVSLDGENWTLSEDDLPLPSAFPDDLVFMENEFHLATNGTLYKSSDLETWTAYAYPLVFTARNLKKVHNLYFLGGEGNFATSTDGENWTKPMEDGDYLDLAYGNDTYVLVGRKAAKGILYTSTNGTDWVSQIDEMDDYDMFYSVDFNDGEFMLCGNNGIVGTSSNGTSWTFTTPVGTSLTLMSIRHILGHWVMNSTLDVYYSVDGATWETASLSGEPVGSLRRLENLNGNGFIPGNTGKILKTNQIASLVEQNSFAVNNIYPNPCSSEINIQFSIPGDVNLSIVDLSGKTVWSIEN